MLKQLAAMLVCVSMLALLISVIHYDPPVGSNIEKVQRGSHCPPGKVYNKVKDMCEKQ